MATKSIHTIEIDDAAFKEFQGRFAKYQQSLQKTSPAWKKVDEAVKVAKGTHDKLRLTTAATVFQIKQAETAQKKFTIAAQGTGRAMGIVAKSTGTIAKNVAKTTLSLLKWVSLGSLFSGLIGTGSLFGIDRLARSASDSRRQSQGLGVGAADLKSAQLNFSKFTDVDSTLGNISDVRSDLGRRWIFSALGIDPDKGSNVDIMSASMKAAKHSFESTGMTQQGAGAHGLTQIYSMDDLRRLHAMTDQEIDDAVAKQKSDRDALAITDKTQRSWQDLNTQLSLASASLENLFINKLATLTGPLGRLSDSVSKAFESFVSSPKIGEWINDLGDAIQRFAKYVASNEFKSDMNDFVTAIKVVGQALYGLAAWVEKWFPAASQTNSQKPVKSAPGIQNPHAPHTISQGFAETWRRILGGDPRKMPDYAPARQEVTGKISYGSKSISGISSDPRNNPGNLRSWSGVPSENGFAKFRTPDDGLKAMASQLQLYQSRDHLKTISEIVKKYAPSSENDTGSYISDVSKRTGFASDSELDLSNKQVLANLMAAMTKHENNKSDFSKETILSVIGSGGGSNRPALPASIEIRNNTGGNAIVTTNALAY